TMQLLPNNARHIQIKDAEALWQCMQHLLKDDPRITPDKDYTCVVAIGPASNLLGIEITDLGNLMRIRGQTSAILRSALQQHATAFVLIRYRPDGDLKPSQEDREVLERLLRVTPLLRLTLEDCLLFSEEHYCSFRALGYLEFLQTMSTCAPLYALTRMARITKPHSCRDALPKAEDTVKTNLLTITKGKRKKRLLHFKAQQMR
ncbi:MAG: JAB domain-containing protein, partial [Bacteroidota bacterium]